MISKNLERFSLTHAKAITDPTVRNLLLASKAALDLTEDCNDVQAAWTWYGVAVDLASTSGIKLQPTYSRFPPTWIALRQVDEALKRLPGEDRAVPLKKGLSTLNLINDLNPTGDQWRECTRADRLCSAAGVPIWDTFGMNHIPTLDEAKKLVEEAINCLEQKKQRVSTTKYGHVNPLDKRGYL